MLFGENILRYQSDIVKELSGISKIRSVRGEALPGKPFGEGSAAALDYALALADSFGFKTACLNHYAGYAEYGEGEEYIAVLTHLDVVPEGEGWHYPPFGGTVENGVLYGRGVSDNKCAGILGIFALKALKDAGVKTKRRVRVVFGCCEETGSEDMDCYFSREPLPVFGITPDSGYPIVNAEKGIMSFWVRGGFSGEKLLSVESGTALNIVPQYCTAVLNAAALTEGDRAVLNAAGGEYAVTEAEGKVTVTATGKYAHAAAPEGGINAIGLMSLLLSRLSGEDKGIAFLRFIREHIGMEFYGEHIGAAFEDAVSGPLTLNMGALHTEEGSLRLGINIRYPVTDSGDRVVAEIGKRVTEAGYVMEDIGDSKPLHVPADSHWIDTLKEAYQSVTGEECRTVAIGGGTYSRHSHNTCVGFGGAGCNEHGIDEQVRIDELMRHGTIMLEAIERLATK